MAGPLYFETSYECPSHEVLAKAASIVRRGGLVVFPTDTLYGLGANPFSRDAVSRVYNIKGRSPRKPLPILLAESHHATMLVDAGKKFWALARLFWPGPLTIVAPPAPDAPEWLAGPEGIGVRLPDSPIARGLARLVGGAIVGTSANKSGMEPPRTAQEAMFMLGSTVEAYIDAGLTPLGKPSTVVRLLPDGRVSLIREGAIPGSKIEEALGEHLYTP